ncbi:MAG: hypothetical protein WBC92_19245 [Terracidiphilus sp.]
MKNEWCKFNLRDRNTYPRDNSRVEMKHADGTQVSGGFLKGNFLQRGVISAAPADQIKLWRYTE